MNDLDHYPFLRGANCARTESRYGLSFSPFSCRALEDGHPRRARCSSRQAERQRQFLAPVRQKLLFLWATAVSAIDPRHPSTSPACYVPMFIPAPHATSLLVNASIAITPTTVPTLWRDGQTRFRCELYTAAGWTQSTNDWTDYHLHVSPSPHGSAVAEQYAITSPPIETIGFADALCSVAALSYGTKIRDAPACYRSPCDFVPNICLRSSLQSSPSVATVRHPCSVRHLITPHAPTCASTCCCPTRSSALPSTEQASMCRVNAQWHPSNSSSPLPALNVADADASYWRQCATSAPIPPRMLLPAPHIQGNRTTRTRGKLRPAHAGHNSGPNPSGRHRPLAAPKARDAAAPGGDAFLIMLSRNCESQQMKTQQVAATACQQEGEQTHVPLSLIHI